MTPGPTEPTCEQLQQYLTKLVDDLLNLWENGKQYRTSKHPLGRVSCQYLGIVLSHFLYLGILVRVILIAIICDHPALCKMCGFADHAHKEAPCTKCKVTAEDLKSEEALQNSLFKDYTYIIIADL
jgi:hypothetical protein